MLFPIGLAVLLLAGAVFSQSTAPTQPSSDVFLFCYFRGNGQDGMRYAVSEDGLDFRPVAGNQSFFRSDLEQGVFRDPSICRGPDGKFHLVFTNSWTSKSLGVAHSDDLITWTKATSIPAMEHEPATMNTWASEIFYDDASKKFVIVWASSVPGKFAETEETGDPDEQGRRKNHRQYCVTTTDFQTYTPTQVFYDGGFSVIDAFIARDGEEYLLFVKDESARPTPKKNLRLARGRSVMGPFGEAGEPISPPGVWSEGPCAIKIGNEWFVYFDRYRERRYGVITSSDLKTWTDRSDALRMPREARHGTVLRVPRALVEAMEQPAN